MNYSDSLRSMRIVAFRRHTLPVLVSFLVPVFLVSVAWLLS